MAYGSPTIMTEAHASVAECKTFYRYIGCGDMKAINWAACSAAAATAGCRSTDEGTALSMPPECS